MAGLSTSNWGGCGTDMGFKKHMEVKHGKGRRSETLNLDH